MLPIRTVLHPTDFSRHSEIAFRLACSLARDYGAELHVLHVEPLPVTALGGAMALPPGSGAPAARQITLEGGMP